MEGRDSVDATKIDPATMGRLAKCLTFICGADHPTTKALGVAAKTGTAKDVKTARTLFLRLKPSERQAALTMLADAD